MTSLNLPQQARIAVAVSGGGDSMALVFLLRDWATDNGGEVLALTVDHGLRDGSSGEAAEVAKTLQNAGIPHKILKWQHDNPSTRLQEKARAARYDLLADAARAADITILATGHNQEDQIETFWMRLAHGSGLDGLAGIAAKRHDKGLTLIRPLLDIARQELRDYCAENNIPVIEDPSNAKEQFLRVRLRGFEDVLAGEGLTPKRLSQVMQKLEDAKSSLNWLTAEAVKVCAAEDASGITLNKEHWLIYPADIRRRIVSSLLQKTVVQDYPAGADALDRLCADMAGDDFAGRTLAGCKISRPKNGHFTITPETV